MLPYTHATCEQIYRSEEVVRELLYCTGGDICSSSGGSAKREYREEEEEEGGSFTKQKKTSDTNGLSRTNHHRRHHYHVCMCVFILLNFICVCARARINQHMPKFHLVNFV